MASIQKTRLPQFHRDTLAAAFLSKTAEEVNLTISLLMEQESMRQKDAMLKIVRRAITERLKHIDVNRKQI